VQQSKAVIRAQIQLPLSEAVRISFQSLRIRFWRSIITTLGILFGIAFLVAVLAGGTIRAAVLSDEVEVIDVLADEAPKGISPQQWWLIIMSLIVCVVGIANAMLMSVTERFREIGTMKCLGALDRFVVILFLLESGFQGLAGAFVGSIVGTLFAVGANLKQFGWKVFYSFPWIVGGSPEAPFGVIPVILGGCIVGMILAVIGAAGPAFRAAKMPPVEAMRVEV
jgi:ABC-type antimicrobial peptide transport system permease subunit